MNKNLSILSIFFVFLVLTGCESNINQESQEVVGVTGDIVSQDIKVTDPEVLKELTFMRDEEMLTEGNYQKFLRSDNIPIIWGSKMSEQYYSDCPESYCDALTSRLMIQNMIKERNSKPIKVTEPEVLQEMKFMRREGILDYSAYESLLHNGAPMSKQSGDVLEERYIGCTESGCNEIIPRAVIQQQMKENSI